MLLFLLSPVNAIFLDLSLNNQPALHYQPTLSFLEGQPILSFLISKSDNTLFLDLMVSTIFPDRSNSLCQSAFPKPTTALSFVEGQPRLLSLDFQIRQHSLF